ncbi:HAD family hydrolase [Xenophilus sp.]|uniref:HAD family hydrolase n=1 Tax=Xenophilus sp. TaxID=1873499 RepID=UPI0037DD9F26
MNVVFDLGAVLIDWEPARLVQAHFPDRAGDEAAAAALAKALFHHEDWLAFDSGLRSAAEVVQRSAARLGLPVAALRELIEPLGERLAPIPETLALLRDLRARRESQGSPRLFYLSNMPAPYARALERRFDFFGWFDGGVFSGDAKRAKPHEEIYQLLAWRHGLEPARTLFIDDAVANVEMARALGWRAIHCTSPAALPRELMRQLEAMEAGAAR